MMIPNILCTIKNIRLKIFIILLFIITSNIFSQSGNADEYVKKAVFFQSKYNSEFQDRNLDSSTYYYEKARELFKLSGDWDHFLNVSIRLAHSHSLLDKSMAISILNETRSIIEDSLRNNSSMEVIYDFLSKMYKEENMYTEAFYELNKLLELRIKKYGKDDQKVAVAHYQIGLYYYETKLFTNADASFKEALRIRKYTNRLSEQPILYKNLAQCAKELGDYEMCISFLDTACLIAEKVFKNPKNDLYNQFGLIYCDVGEYKKAKLAFQRSSALTTAPDDKKSLRLFKVYRSMAEIFIAEGDYVNAKNYLDKTEDILKNNSSGYAWFGEYYLTRIELLIIMEDYKEALLLIEKYKTLTENIIDDDVTLLNFYSLQGLVYFHQKNYSQSLACFKKILLFYSDSNIKNNPRLNRIFRLIGEIYLISGDYNNAITYLNKSLDQNKKLHGENSTYVAESYISLTKLDLMQNNYKMALKNITEACTALGLNLKGLGDISGKVTKTLNDKVLLLEALSYYNTIIEEHYRKTKNKLYIKELQEGYIISAVLMENLKIELATQASKLYWTEKTYNFFERAIVTLVELYYNTSDSLLLETAFYLTEKSKSNLLLNSLSLQQAKRNIVDKNLIYSENILLEEISLLKRLIKSERERFLPDTRRLNIWSKRLMNTCLRYEQFINQLQEKYPEVISEAGRQDHISIKTIQDNIGAHELLLNYFVGKKSIIIFSIKKDKYQVTAIEDSILSKDLEIYHDLLRKKANLIRNKNLERFLHLSNELYDRILFPAIKYYPDVTKLIIIPSDKLNNIPFETLISERNNSTTFKEQHFIIYDYEIAYSYSVNLYFNLSCNHIENNSFIGFAPVFNTGNDSSVVALSYTIKEVKYIDSLFREKGRYSKTYINKDATEDQLKRCFYDSCAVLHISSHNICNLNDPDQSGILFFKDEKSVQDGILFNDEIYYSRLNTNLIVLSCCQGGVGKYIEGEGTFSISRAFINSGASNAIFSLWDVSDRHTYNLMIGFYNNLINGNRYSSSLRNSKLAMLSNEFTASPDIWSSFILLESYNSSH